MDRHIFWLAMILLGVATVVAAFAIWRFWLAQRRNTMIRRLVDGADRLEARIKQCRARLGQAHAAVRVLPEVPSAGSANADQAIDAALRNLLAHRLWIRDEAPSASHKQLKRAVTALEQAGDQVEQQLGQLQQAQHELDTAVQELQSSQ